MPPPERGGDGAPSMTGEERRACDSLVAIVAGAGVERDAVLLLLRECRGDVDETARRLLDSACA
jgi:hypothetical protein